jgi:hypothetical protein
VLKTFQDEKLHAFDVFDTSALHATCICTKQQTFQRFNHYVFISFVPDHSSETRILQVQYNICTKSSLYLCSVRSPPPGREQFPIRAAPQNQRLASRDPGPSLALPACIKYTSPALISPAQPASNIPAQPSLVQLSLHQIY